jgi:ArsR family transcriptional regulator
MTCERTAIVFKALAHPFRLQILCLLSAGETCVCRLVEVTGRPQPYVSQHMRVLREAGLVVCKKEGRRVHYQICKLDPSALINLVEDIAGKSVVSKATRDVRLGEPEHCCAREDILR